MSPTRQDAAWQELAGHTYFELAHRGTIDWHYHDVEQVVYPSSGVLAISAAAATWVVPPQRAVWIPAGVPHAHQAHGAVQVRTLSISSAAVDRPLPGGPAVLERGVQARLRRHPGQVLHRRLPHRRPADFIRGP